MSDFAAQLRQMAQEIGQAPVSAVFAEEPVSLTTFVQDKAYLGNPPLSPVQYDAVRHIERVYYPATYATLAKEFESGKKTQALHVGAVSAWRDEPYWSQPARMTNFATLQWGKGCICPNVPIYDARTGRWLPVSEAGPLTVQSVDAVNLDGTTEHLPGSPALVRGSTSITASAGTPFKRGFGRCVRVRTATGSETDVYVGHLFVSWQSNDLPYVNRYLLAKPIWQQAGALQPGDRIAVLSKLDCLEPVAQDPREVELVGYWIGDGSMPLGPSSQWAFYIDSAPVADQLRNRYVSLVESYEGITAKLETMRSGTMRIRATTSGSGRKIRTPLIDIIRRWGLHGSRAWNKRVPPEFFSLPDDQLAMFLSALWDTDGSIFFKFGRVPALEYVSVSEGLIRDVQKLLYRFGVVSRVTSSIKRYTYLGEVREGRRAWRLVVNADQYVKRLLSVLRLHGEKERRRGEALEWVCAAPQQVLDGDVYWDTVTSVEDIGDSEYWDLHVPLAGTYVAGTSPFINSNSGKDHVCRLISMRIAYLLMCLDSPQDYYGMPEQDTIHLLNVASSSGQAQQAFFMPITRAVARKGNWFLGKCQPKQNTISFAKNIEAVSGHSDAESQEGLNLMLGIADEIDAFKSKKEMSTRRGANSREPSKSAEGILNMMKSSGSTRFPEVFKQIRISYPRYLGSTIQQLTAEAKADVREKGKASRHFVSGPLATWEVNPRITGKEVFADDYKEDPGTARAKYECKPNRAVNPYFRNAVALDACFTPTPVMPLEVTYRVEQTGSKSVWVPQYHFASDFHPVRGAAYAMHGDLAVMGDRAGIAMAHVLRYDEAESVAEDEDGAMHTIRETRPVVKVDFVISFTADSSESPPREIQIRWARQLAFELLRRGFNIKRYTFDTFQSVDSMQILESKGIESIKVSADSSEEPYKNLRDLMYEGRITIPRPMISAEDGAPRFLLRDELLSLSRLPNGRIDHPADGVSSKDEADALACAALGAVEIGGQEEAGGARAHYTKPDFTVGSSFSLPLGCNPATMWEREIPAPF